MKKLLLLIIPLFILTGCNVVSMQEKIFCKRAGEETCTGGCESKGLTSTTISIDPVANLITLSYANISKTYEGSIFKEHSIYRLNIIDADFFEKYDRWAMVLDPKSGNYTEMKEITFEKSTQGSSKFEADGVCQNSES